jgi:hypothetical protein
MQTCTAQQIAAAKLVMRELKRFADKAALTTAIKLQQNCNKTKIKLKHKTVVLKRRLQLQ